MLKPSLRTAGLAAGIALVSVAVLATPGAGPGTGQSLIAYRGHLDLNGSAVTGTSQFRVGLFNTGTAGAAACLSTGTSSCGVWADQFDNVPVAAGTFSLVLGSGNVPIPDTVFSAQGELYVGMAVGDGVGNFTVLSGMQRLTSLGYAVRAERANTFSVDSDLSVGGNMALGPAPGVLPARRVNVENGELRVRATHNNGTADIAQFYANNLTQGVGIGYGSVEAVGSYADQSLTLRAQGTGHVVLDSPATARSIITDETGAVTAYARSLDRLVYVAHNSGNANYRSYTPIPPAVMQTYCGDEDGCRITLRMRNWDAGASFQNATSFSFHFNWGTTTTAGQTPWRREEMNGTGNPSIVLGAVAGLDGDGIAASVVLNHNCNFLDGTVLIPSGTPSDPGGSGMGLLNSSTTPTYTGMCELIIDD